MEKIILIPAYCPEGKLVSIVQQAHQKGYQCLVVNDGSPESYQTIVIRS